MAEIIIYTKSYCPFSKNCKKFFEDKGVSYDEKVIDNDNVLTQEMLTKSGNRSDTPQVFINGHHIGSFDDIKALDSQGKLNEMIDLK
ncbi:glutaredoxin domain-containing protein [Patescibacteria group bacterium]